MSWVRVAAIGGLGTFVGIVLLEHILVPGLTPARHMISEYANARAGPLMVFAFLAWGASLGATAGLARGQAILAGMLLAAALGAVVTACFATQAVGGVIPHGVHLGLGGRLHDLGSGVLSLALLAAVSLSIRQAVLPPGFRVRTTVLLVLSVAGAAALLIVGDPAPGIRQRLLVATACIWQAMLLHVLGSRRAGEQRDQTSRSASAAASAADATRPLRSMSR